MSDTEVRVVLADGVVVGPDECLIIHVADWDDDIIQELLDELVRIGLKDRSFVIRGDVKFTKAKVKKDPKTKLGTERKWW